MWKLMGEVILKLKFHFQFQFQFISFAVPAYNRCYAEPLQGLWAVEAISNTYLHL
jgi:hypothetical protein